MSISQKKYLDTLAEFVSFKSVSTDSSFTSEISATVDWLVELLSSSGAKPQVFSDYDNPIIFCEIEAKPEYPTVIVYGHYDVQPADPIDWPFDPFTLKQDANRVFARGAVDNKGQILIHILTVLELQARKQLQYNVKFLLEGNEETGSAKLDKFIAEHQDLLRADFSLTSDGEITSDLPTLDAGYRGIANFTINIKTANTEIHSGIFGGAAPNAALELSKLLSKLIDSQNKVTLPGFYEHVAPPSAEELQNDRALPFDLKSYQDTIGIKDIITEPDYNFYTQTGLRPTAVVTGMIAGYNGPGYKSGIPNFAQARLNFRLVDGQDPAKLEQQLHSFVQKNLPDYADYEIPQKEESEGFVAAIKTDIHNKYVQKAQSILKSVYNQDPVFRYVGGTIPVIYFIDKLLRIPQVLVPLANEDCNMHGVKENFALLNISKGLEFSNQFFSNA